MSLRWRLNPLRNLFAAQGFEQRREEVDQGQHHQGEAGVLLAEGVVAAVLLGLIL